MHRHPHLALASFIKPIALAAVVACAPLAQAAFTTLTLPTLNLDIRTATDGASYNPLFPGTQTWNGTPFQLDVDANGNTIFSVGVLNIAVGIFGVTQAYSIINSGFGAFGSNNGSMEFFGTNGSYYKVDLIQGTNIRDHYDGFFNNTIDNVTAIAAFNLGPGRARFDEQIYNLPMAFANETLNTIRFTSVDLGANGQAFIAAATVRTADATSVPEPGSIALVLAGLGLAGWQRKRQS